MAKLDDSIVSQVSLVESEQENGDRHNSVNAVKV